MALGGGKMSSSLIANPTVMPLATQSNSGNDNGGGMARGANYFFGFLITFVVLLLLFVGCGIGTRRRYVARRAAIMEENGWMVDRPRPTFFEHPLTKGDVRWRDAMPLSVVFIPKEKKYPSSVDQRESPSHEHPSRPRFRIPSLSLRSLLLIPGHKMDRENEKEPEFDPPEKVAVAFLIAMPAPHDRPPDRQYPRLEEYQLGITCQPWDYEEMK